MSTAPTRRQALLGSAAFSLSLGGVLMPGSAFACHLYVSPVDGGVGCGFRDRDLKNGVSGDSGSTSTSTSGSPDCEPSTPVSELKPPPSTSTVSEPQSSTSGTCVGTGDVTLTKPGTYKGCGNIGILTIAGADILVSGVRARRIVFNGATRARVTGSVVDSEKSGRSGIYVTNSSNITFDNNKITNVVGMGADIRPQNLKGLIIRDNHFSGIRRSGAGQIGENHGSGIIIGHWWKDSTPNVNPGVVIEGNRFDNFDTYGDAMSAIAVKSNYVIIRNNTIDAADADIITRHGYGVQILNNRFTSIARGIRIMGDNHVVNGNTARAIRVFGGNVTMDDYSSGKVTSGGMYPVARNIKLNANSVAPGVSCYGSCPYRPTYSGQ